MLHSFKLSLLFSVLLPTLFKRVVASESIAVVGCGPNEALLQVEIKPDYYPGGISMVLWDLSFGEQVTIVAEGFDVVKATTTPVLQKEICLPTNHHEYMLIIYDSFSDGGNYPYRDVWYRVTYDGAVIKEGGDFQTSDYVQFGEGCLPTDDTANATSKGCACGDNETSFQIEIKPDAFPDKISVILSDLSSGVEDTIVADGLIPRDYISTIEIRRCLPANHCHVLTIYDSEGGGICCDEGEGWYKVTYDGDTVKEGGEFYRSDAVQFGGECLPPAVVDNSTNNECGDNEVSLRIDLRPDRFPDEISMVLRELSSGVEDSIVAFGSITVNHTAPIMQIDRCLPVEYIYIFAIYDSYGDGICCDEGEGWYRVTYDGAMVKEGGDFQTSDYVQFGEGCLPTDDTANSTSNGCACGDNEAPFQIEIKPDAFPDEISVILSDLSSGVEDNIVADGLFPRDYVSIIVIRRCLPTNHDYILAIYDSYGDGICCDWGEGWYKVTYDGAMVKEGGDFQTSDYVQFGEGCLPTDDTANATSKGCACGDNETSFQIEIKPDAFPDKISVILSDLSSGVEDTIVADGLIPRDYISTIEIRRCLPANHCHVLTIYDSEGGGICCDEQGEGWYKVKYDGDTVKEGGEFHRSDAVQFGGECLPPAVVDNSTNDKCGDNEVSLRIDLRPDRFPDEISIVLTELSSGVQDTIVAFGSIAVNHTAPIMQIDRCLPANHWYIFAIYDSYGDGICCDEGEGWYTVTYNGEIVKEGGKFKRSDNVHFGEGCLIALDGEGRRYFPKLPDRSEWSHAVPTLPNCTEQGRIGCIVHPSSSQRATSPLPRSISHSQNPACVNGACTIGIPMSKQYVGFSESLLINLQDIGFTEANTRSLPNSFVGHSYDIAAGDLNGDGLVDIVLAKYSMNNQIWLNSGNKATPFNVAPIDIPDLDGDTTVVKLADVDNDGLLDILFISDRKAFVLHNNILDPLNFRTVALDIGGGLYPYDLSVGDANNDGWLDIIIGTFSGIVLFLNMQNGTFDDKIELPRLGRASAKVAFADVDNDGWVDIISLSDGDVRVFMNKYGNGTFLEEDATTISGDYTRFCVGDMDGDGLIDLILLDRLDVLLFLNGNGKGQELFDKGNAVTAGGILITSVEAGDLNGDGMIDLVFGTYYGVVSPNFMMLNKGGGEFTEAIELPGTSSWTRGIVIADVNNDSALDIVFANNWDGEVDDEVLLNLLPIDSSSSFGAALSLPGGGYTSTTTSAVSDFNQDGFIDIVVGNNNGQADQILLNNGDGSFLKEDVIDLPTSLSSSDTLAVAVGNIVGDNLPDIVVCGKVGCEILRNNGNLTFDPIISLSGWGSYAIGIGDVNNDTFMDVIIGGNGSYGDTLFINNNGTFSTDNSIELPGFNLGWYTRSITLADFNGDNRLDIVIGCYGGCDNRLLINNEDDNGNFNNSTVLVLPTGNDYKTRAVAVADFDGDGHIDIIFGGENEPVIVLFNDGAGGFNENSKIELPGGIRDVNSIALADIDGDDYDDIILGIAGAGTENEILMNNGDRSFLDPNPLPGVKLATSSILAIDANSDGWIDIVVGNIIGENQIIPFADPCPNGGAQLHSRSWCFHCPSFMGLPADSSFLKHCKECLPDHIQQPGLGEQCDVTPCPRLAERLLGQDQCSPCPNGTFYDNFLMRIESDITTWINASDRCVQCPIGTYANKQVTAIDKCFQCVPGTYQNETGSGACKTCELGTFQKDFKQPKCEVCDIGGYCNVKESCNGGFEPCPAGTFNNRTGLSSQDECMPCDAGDYAPNTGSIECIPCPYPLSSAVGSKLCSFCRKGFYVDGDNVSAEDLAADSARYCKECPNGADCQVHGTNLTMLPVEEGYWRDSQHTSTLYPCKKNACVGRQPTNRRRGLQVETSDIYCADNQTGPLCEVCINNTTDYFSSSNGRCITCPTTSTLILRMFIALLIVSVVIAACWWILITQLSTFSIVLTSLSLQAKVKILVGFYQVMSSFRVVYGISIHGKLKAWFSFFNVISLDFFRVLNIPRDCLGSKKVAFILNACWPYILCAVLITALLLFLTIRESLKETKSTDIKARFGMRSLYIVIAVLYFALPTVSRSIFDAKKCRAFKTNDAKDAIKSYLLFAMEMECDEIEDKNYSSLLDLFWVFFALWPCLTPLLFLLLLTKINKSVQKNRPTPLARTCRFLWEDFDETSAVALHWDVIDTMRKIFLTGFINFLDAKEGSNKILRLSVACTVSTLYLTILTIVRPYKRDDDFHLSTISSFLMVLCFGLGIILHLCEGEDDDDENEGTCHTFVGLHLDSYKASIAVTALAFGMLLIAICVTLLQVYRAPIVRLQSTGYPPNLEMPQNCENHIFLSHVWSSGQDKTHAVARTLQLYLPRLKIWLDVDDLEDVGRLEEYIAESAVILIFYSEGYFRSKNCRREFYHAVVIEKPIIVVYDGYASILEEMKEECVMCCADDSPVEVHRLLDILMKDPIQWLKEGVFSAESLKLVYFHLLRNLPFYRNINKRHILDKGLRMPNDIVNVPLPSSIELLVCEANGGACDLAIEIQRQEPEKITIKTLRDVKSSQDDRSNSPKSIFPTVCEIDDIGAGLEDEAAEDMENICLETERDPLTAPKQILLLYLNKDTFSDVEGSVAAVVKVAKQKGIDIILAHEQDIDKGGCPFSYFFKNTPEELIDYPFTIYKDIAIPLYSRDEYRKMSLSLILNKIGSEER